MFSSTRFSFGWTRLGADVGEADVLLLEHRRERNLELLGLAPVDGEPGIGGGELEIGKVGYDRYLMGLLQRVAHLDRSRDAADAAAENYHVSHFKILSGSRGAATSYIFKGRELFILFNQSLALRPC